MIVSLKYLPPTASVQILTNGDYDGCDRELGPPTELSVFIDAIQQDEESIEDTFRAWEYPDGEQTCHLLTVINGHIHRVVVDC